MLCSPRILLWTTTEMTNTSSIRNQQLLLPFERIKLHHCIKHIFIRLIGEYHHLNRLTATLFRLFVFCCSIIVLSAWEANPYQKEAEIGQKVSESVGQTHRTAEGRTVRKGQSGLQTMAAEWFTWIKTMYSRMSHAHPGFGGVTYCRMTLNMLLYPWHT